MVIKFFNKFLPKLSIRRVDFSLIMCYHGRVKAKNKQLKNKMKKISIKNSKVTSLKALAILVIVGVFGFSIFSSIIAKADQYQDQINALSDQNSQFRQSQGVLSIEASSLTDAISKLQAQIDSTQNRINQLNDDIARLKVQISDTETELARQKLLLGASIKAMYVSGDISTVEMLASSKNLSDFFDKTQYQDSVKTKIKNTLDKVTQLKLELNTKKELVEKSLTEQESLRSQLSSQKAEKDRVLAMNQSQQNQLESQIQSNNSQMSRLRAEQAAAYAAYLAKNRGASYGVGESGNGGYPSIWANAPQDTIIDNWGMYNRECVSYVAWKVDSSGRFMPYWGGVGNAYEWPGNARRARIPVDNTPTVGSVAVWGSNAGLGWLGHVAYVEVVNGDRSIEVSQYNFIHGQFSRMHVGANEVSRLEFIHF